MIDNSFKNAFKEIWIILQNTDEELVSKIPKKFIQFIHENMNANFETNIKTDSPIDKQSLLPETEALLSLIYRSYWATDEEKIAFETKDKQELFAKQEKVKINVKTIDDIFQKDKNLNNITLDTSLAVIQKENIFKRFFNKLKRALWHS